MVRPRSSSLPTNSSVTIGRRVKPGSIRLSRTAESRATPTRLAAITIARCPRVCRAGATKSTSAPRAGSTRVADRRRELKSYAVRRVPPTVPDPARGHPFIARSVHTFKFRTGSLRPRKFGAQRLERAAMLTTHPSSVVQKRDLHVGGLGSSASGALAAVTDPLRDAADSWLERARDVAQEADDYLRRNPLAS